MSEIESKLSQWLSSVNTNTSGNNVSFMIPREDLLPDPLPDDVVVTFAVLYILIMVLALFGNVSVIIIIGCVKKVRSIMDYFILSLAVSDLGIATLNMPFHLYVTVANEWMAEGKTGEFLCKVTNYIQGIAVVSSILTLLVIAIDRYVVICNHKASTTIHTKTSARFLLVAVWVVSLCAISPHLVFQRLDKRIKVREFGSFLIPQGIGHLCMEFVPGDYGSQVFTAFTYVFFYVLPVAIIAYTYGKIAHRVWIHPQVGTILENPLHHQRVVLPKMKIIKIMIVVVLAFTILWMPFFTFSLYDEFVKTYDTSFKIKMATLKLIGYSNCCVNPIIYAFLNNNYQREFRQLFCQNRVSTVRDVQVTAESHGTHTETLRRSRY